MGSVQIDSDGASRIRLTRAYTISTATNLSIYCRVKFPNILSTWALPWTLASAANIVGLKLNGGSSTVEWDNDSSATTIFTSASNSVWYDFAILKNGSNVDIYYKASTTGVWTGPVSAPCLTFTPTRITLGDYPNSASLANKPVRYGKIVVWDTVQSSATVQAEANGRALQDLSSGHVWFFDACDSLDQFGTDQSTAAHSFIAHGAPAANADDPAFAADAFVTSFSPATGATGVNPRAPLQIVFAQNMQAGTGNFVLKNDTLGTTVETIPVANVTISSATVTIPLTLPLTYGHAYHVEADSGVVQKASDSSNWTGISERTSWHFNALKAIEFVASGVTIFSTAGGTTVAPTWPTTAPSSPGDIDLLFVGTKPTTSGAAEVAVPDSAGFRRLATLNAAGGYGGSSAADTGDTDLHVYWRPASPATSGSITVTTTTGATNGVSWAKILRFKKNIAGRIVALAATGSQSSAANLSIAFGSDPRAWKTRPGDMIVCCFGSPTDINVSTNYLTEAFTQTGVTFGPVVTSENWASANGFDIGGIASYAQVLAGKGLDKLTLSATMVSTTNARGPAAMVRLRVEPSRVAAAA